MKLIYGHRTKGLWWIRLWNCYGIKYKNLKYHVLMFSERYGHTKVYKIGNHCFTFLSNKN